MCFKTSAKVWKSYRIYKKGILTTIFRDPGVAVYPVRNAYMPKIMLCWIAITNEITIM